MLPKYFCAPVLMLIFSLTPQVPDYASAMFLVLPVPPVLHKHCWNGIKYLCSSSGDPFFPSHQLEGTYLVPNALGWWKLTLSDWVNTLLRPESTQRVCQRTCTEVIILPLKEQNQGYVVDMYCAPGLWRREKDPTELAVTEFSGRHGKNPFLESVDLGHFFFLDHPCSLLRKKQILNLLSRSGFFIFTFTKV